MDSKLYIRICLLALLLMGVVLVTNAQINSYTFSQGMLSNSQFASYIGGAFHYTLEPSNASINPLKCVYAGDTVGTSASYVNGEGFPIGFNFTYNGEVYDRIAIGGDGYIKLGKSNETITILNDTIPGTIFDNAALHNNVIAALQLDANTFGPQPGGTNAINIGITGIPGNRICVVDYSYYGNNGIIWEYQIQLCEMNNVVGFAYYVFGLWAPYNIHGQAAVGITGNQDFINRKIINGTNTWLTSIQGNSDSDLCDLNSSLMPGSPNPAQVLYYTWTPPVPAPSAPTCPFSFFYVDTTYNGLAYSQYILANGATNVVTNPTLYWSDVSVTSNQPTTYDVYLDISNPPLIPVAQNLTTTSYTPSILAPNTTYYYNIVPKNASGEDSACVGSFTTNSTLQYCLVNYGSGRINSFAVNTLSFTASNSNNQEKLPAISPYTTALKRDTTYNCIITINSIDANTYPYSNTTGVAAWIDFNQDGNFNDPGDTVGSGSAGLNGTIAFPISIPNTAKLGTTTMRLAWKGDNYESLTPCANNYDLGGDEDFTVTITPTTSCQSFTITPVITNVNCFGQSNGSINLNSAGGAIPYTINWTDGSTTDKITNLTKGIYQATVTDANSCEIATPLIPVLQPMALSVDTATASNNITTILASGGTAPYSYLWSNGDTSSNSSNLAAGTYSITVTDAHGCDTTMQNIIIKQTNTGTIPPPPPPVDSIKDSSVNIIVYPNPTSGIIYLQSQVQQTIHVQVVSEQGKVLLQGDYIINANTPASIDAASFAGGIYFLKVVGDKASTVVKIIKQ
jgi:hypothetical protein